MRWPRSDHPVMRGHSQPGAVPPRRTDRRIQIVERYPAPATKCNGIAAPGLRGAVIPVQGRASLGGLSQLAPLGKHARLVRLLPAGQEFVADRGE